MAVRLSWVLGLVLLDLFSKAGVFAWVGDLDAAGELVRDHDGHRRLPLFGTEWFAFMLSMNPGAAFGCLGDIPHLLVGGRIACTFLLATWLVGVEGCRRVSLVALTLVLAGATGNLYDNLILVESSAAIAVHVAVFVAFGVAWCLGGRGMRWAAVATMVAIAAVLEWTDFEPTYGAVRDFIDVYTPQLVREIHPLSWVGIDSELDMTLPPWGAHFPTFNLADSCISVGAVLLILTGLKDPKKDKPEPIAQTPVEG